MRQLDRWITVFCCLIPATAFTGILFFKVPLFMVMLLGWILFSFLLYLLLKKGLISQAAANNSSIYRDPYPDSVTMPSRDQNE